LHLTFYSSLIIDFAARSIPSIILPSFDYTKHNYGLNIGKRVFVDQLGYPIDFDKNILKKINDYSKDIEIYKNDAMAVKRWHSKVQMPFNEKLFEEILIESEGLLSTHNKLIFISKKESVNDKFDVLINELISLAFNCEDEFDIVKKIKEIIPEYRSNQSKFQKLDK